jgi:hypothetical protein
MVPQVFGFSLMEGSSLNSVLPTCFLSSFPQNVKKGREKGGKKGGKGEEGEKRKGG